MAATRIQVAARPSVLELDTRETAVILDSPSDPGTIPGYWTEERRSRWVAAREPTTPTDNARHLPPGVMESDILPQLAPRTTARRGHHRQTTP